MTEDERIAGKKAELDALRPVSGPSLKALDAWYDVELTYTSNALEGNTLTRSETAIVLEKGFTVSGKPLKDHLEAIGHRDALAYVRELGTDHEGPVREADVRNMDRLVLQKIDPDEAGRYSKHGRVISGSSLVLPSPAEIPSRMGDFTRWLGTAPRTPEAAFDAHEGLVTIHPFSDGNGRTARLLMNLLLLKTGYPPVVIRPEDRPAYHDSLEAVQIRDDRSAYHRFMKVRLESALDHHLEILKRGLDQ
ncbi:MAG: Fic family protein [Rhodospirillales bacterium]|nr:Fic family protein [Acetobacter sp.]